MLFGASLLIQMHNMCDHTCTCVHTYMISRPHQLFRDWKASKIHLMSTAALSIWKISLWHMYTTLFFSSPPGSDDGLQELVFTDCCPTNPAENDDDQSEVRSMSRAKKVRVFRFLVCYVTIWYLGTDQCINARTSAVRIICYISMYFQPDQYPLQ